MSHKGRIRGNIGVFLAGLTLFATSASAQIAAEGLFPRAPLMVTPLISGILSCNGGYRNTALKTLEEIEAWCAANHQTDDLAAKTLLDQIEPQGPRGKVHLGYTLLVPLLELYERRDGRWKISDAKVQKYLNVISAIGRPAVVYLMGNHFDSSSELSQELAQNPDNLMSYASGPMTASRYLGHGVIPFTLRDDESIPVNHYRFKALRHVARQIAAMEPQTRSRIVAITLAGELHQMYPDFENGSGAFDNIQVTDYSPGSQQDFRDWLKRKYGTIAKLNQQLGFTFPGFASIEAPSRDIRKTTLQSFSQHYDSYADGSLPIFGWLWDPHQAIDKLSLYVDGQLRGVVPQGLGRIDVSRAKPEVTSTSTGFRDVIDFRHVAPGKHVAQIVAQAKGKQYLVAEREFMVVPRDQSSTASTTEPHRLTNLPPAQQLDGVQYWLDSPRPLQDVYYNPLAREWNLFRAQQVNRLLAHFYRIARSEGIAPALLYSHQIVPELNGSWNPVLFESGASISNTTLWRNGVNQYGASKGMIQFLNDRHVRAYGVPEFNPLQGRNPEAVREAFVAHYRAGAKFVSPFFLSTIPERMRGPNYKRQFEIAADNPVDAGDVLFDALQWFVRH